MGQNSSADWVVGLYLRSHEEGKLQLLQASNRTCEDQLRNTKTAEVCFSISHAGYDSPSTCSTKFDPEPNRLLQCRLACRLATAQHHSASGSHQRCCSSGTA